jgi:hypothetical protein
MCCIRKIAPTTGTVTIKCRLYITGTYGTSLQTVGYLPQNANMNYITSGLLYTNYNTPITDFGIYEISSSGVLKFGFPSGNQPSIVYLSCSYIASNAYLNSGEFP